MVAERREKVADFIHFITEKATLENGSGVEAGGRWALQAGTRFCRVDF